MKKLSLLLVAILFAVTGIFAQTPEMFKYQAVLRDASGNILANQSKTVIIDILQTSPSGTSVFTESHSVTTTAQGLINLNIGSIENLSGIDWSADEYFIQITVDGTIMGTSQLLSVPYALTAKTVETVDYSQITNTPTLFDGDYNSLSSLPTLFDGDWTSLSGTAPNVSTFNNDAGYLTEFNEVDGSVTNEIQTLSLSGNDLTISGTGGNTVTLPIADGSETKLTAGTNVTITGAGTTASPYVINASSGSSPTYTIGLNTDLGGYVFFVTPDGKHGLVAETQDQSTSCNWYNAQNIISNPANHSTAGKNFTDWRLPTKYELNLMYGQKANIGGFTANYYWCSTEGSYYLAWFQSFSDGSQNGLDKSSPDYVRGVRAF